jgi:hypothetical protein
MKNGAAAGLTSNVALLLCYNGNVYQQNTSGNWYEYTGGTSYWPALAGDPRGTSSSSSSSGGSSSGASSITATPAALLNYINGLSGQTKHILVGQHTATIYATSAIGVGGGSLVTPIPGQSGGKQVAMLGVANDWNNDGGQPDLISVSNAWLASGGIVFVSEDLHTFLPSGGNVADYWTPGTATNTALTAFLRTQAAKFKQINGAVIWRPMTEPNGNHFCSSSAGTYTGAQCVHIWQYIHDYIISQGVTNIVWNMNFNNSYSSTNDSQYYPGSNYVDLLTVDAYPPSAAAIANDYSFFLTTGKPIMLGETGFYTGSGADFSKDYSALLQTIKSIMPKIAGVMVWCDNDALVNQNGVSAFMNDPAVVTLSDLPH